MITNLEELRPNSREGLKAFLDDAGYLIFAVSRRPAGLFGYNYSLDHHTVADLAGLSMKMTFLIPGSSREWFEELSQKTGTWRMDALSPGSVAAFLSGFGTD